MWYLKLVIRDYETYFRANYLLVSYLIYCLYSCINPSKFISNFSTNQNITLSYQIHSQLFSIPLNFIKLFINF